MGEFIERRAYTRWNFSALPWVFALQLESAAKNEPPLRLEAKNISQGGIKFFSNKKITLFETSTAEIYLKENGKMIASLPGKVIRVEEIDTGFGEKTYGIALSFLPGSAKALAETLK